MISDMKKIKNVAGHIVGFFGLGIVVGLLLLFAVARLTWHNKFYPNLSIAGVEVGGLTLEQARTKIVNATNSYQPVFGFNGFSWVAPLNMVNYEIEVSLNEVYGYGRRLKVADYLLLLVNKQTNFPLAVAEGKTEVMEVFVNEIAASVEIPPVDPEVALRGKSVSVINGVDGVVINASVLDELVKSRYAMLGKEPVEIPTLTAKRQLSDGALLLIKARAEKLASSSVTMGVDDEKLVLNGGGLIALLATDGENWLNKAAIQEYVMGMGESLNVEPQDAKFAIEAGVVKEFAPGKDGLEVNVQQTANNLQLGIEKLLESENTSEKVEIAVIRTPPQVTTDKVNELGIRERIGRGESFYAHSIPNRIYNVALASTRLNSALVPPGEEVSFNRLVGEVSGATGYRPAYIISGGRTVLGDGGGLCQVSTTMFRAAMSAGLPILERWGHAYRVSYYELNSKPGVDATVIAPSKDFRFLNDTPGHILIQTINDPKNLHLIIEIYGTSDGRVATMSEPKVWGITGPLPTIYQDDPTLPTGTMRQVDWAASGAKASFDYRVVRNGGTLQEKTFTTSYRPWAAVYLRGTGQ